MEEHVLDNPSWHMLCHDLAEFTVGTALAKRCDPGLIPVVGLANHSDAAFADLATLYNTGEGIGILEANPPQKIPGFEISSRFSFDQLVCQQRTPVPKNDIDVLELTQSDLQDVIQLIELTKPGPFFPGLFAMRRFVGIRQEGQLVAMAGERIHLPGYCEISAVCTHPDWRGRGYASLLSSVIADGIWERGKTPFLHVLAHNTSAYHVYNLLHFVRRGEMTAIFLTRS